MGLSLSNINWAAIGSKIMYWLTYIVFIGGMMGAIFLFLHMKKHKYKVTFWEVTGNINEGGIHIDRPKKNRFRWNKNKTAWIPLWPLFKKDKKTVEPFEDKFIYPGHNLYALRYGDFYVPVSINIGGKLVRETEELVGGVVQTVRKEYPTGVIDPIPYHVKSWQQMELKQNETEFKKHSLWEDNKYVFTTIVCVALCVGMCLLTVWWTYNYAQGAGGEVQGIVDKAIGAISTKAGAPAG